MLFVLQFVNEDVAYHAMPRASLFRAAVVRDRLVFSESLPVADLLVRTAAHHPDRLAFVLPGERLAFGELLARAELAARGLLGLGVRPGDHVGLLAPNSPEFLEGFFAATLIGAVVVSLNVRHRSAELRYIIDHAELAAVLTSDRIAYRTDFREVMADAVPGLDETQDPRSLRLPGAPFIRAVVMLRGQGGHGCLGRVEFDALAATVDVAQVHRLRSQVRVRDTAVILYTSGTTAHPKGCLITHESASRANGACS